MVRKGAEQFKVRVDRRLWTSGPDSPAWTKIEQRDELSGARQRRASNALLSEARSRPRSCAGQPKVTVSSTIGLSKGSVQPPTFATCE